MKLASAPGIREPSAFPIDPLSSGRAGIRVLVAGESFRLFPVSVEVRVLGWATKCLEEKAHLKSCGLRIMTELHSSGPMGHSIIQVKLLCAGDSFIGGRSETALWKDGNMDRSPRAIVVWYFNVAVEL